MHSVSSENVTYLLPPAAYTSVEWFEREQRELFAKAWLLAGLERDVPNPGDFLTVQAGTEPLAVIRQRDGSLRAFFNICRHRGAMLLHGSGNVSAGVSCFYHHWHYNLDGTLRGVPQAEKFPTVTADKSKFGLRPASVATWNGLIFVNAEQAPKQSLQGWLADLPSQWGPWKPGELHELPANSIDVACNWKLFMENHIDGYHLWHLHAQSVRGLLHEKQSWKRCGRHWRFYEPEQNPGIASDRDWFNLPAISGVDHSRYGSSVYMLFPNVGVGGFTTFFALFVAEPLTVDRTRVKFRTFIKPLTDQDYTGSPDLRARVEAISSTPIFGYEEAASRPFTDRLAAAARRSDFVIEDKLAVEAIQRTLRSQHFEVGPLARDYEESIPFFHEEILQFVPPDTRGSE
jgi:phenylpropionate dioxygenase-like ring-hydroxylating dioxygenase large terminal subunit